MSECVGFADCPCTRCRATRREATVRHGAHVAGDSSYCGACRTARREAANARVACEHGFVSGCWRGECRFGCYYPEVCTDPPQAVAS